MGKAIQMKGYIKAFVNSDIVRRAVKTFVQAAIATWVASGQQVNKAVIVASIAAGISAVWNFVIKTM
jgi:hypothetical protein